MIFSDCEGGFLEGGKGADSFDCGEGIDLDFEPANGDIIKNDCETS